MRELFRIIAYLLFWGVLIAACYLVPLGLAARVHPLAGCLAAGFEAWLWMRLVPARPGCIQGIVCIQGFVLIVASLIWCVVLWLRSL